MRRYGVLLFQFVLLLLFAFLCLAPAFVYADDGGASAPGSTVALILRFLEIAVFPAIGMFLYAVAKRGIEVFEAKTGYDISAQQERLLYSALDKGIAYAEEQARKSFTEAGKKMTGLQKLDTASRFVMEMADTYGLDDLAEEKVRKLLEAQLNNSRRFGLAVGQIDPMTEKVIEEVKGEIAA
jgi:hypothetical protein